MLLVSSSMTVKETDEYFIPSMGNVEHRNEEWRPNERKKSQKNGSRKNKQKRKTKQRAKKRMEKEEKTKKFLFMFSHVYM